MWAITEIKALGAISLVWLHLPIFLAEMLQLKTSGKFGTLGFSSIPSGCTGGICRRTSRSFAYLALPMYAGHVRESFGTEAVSERSEWQSANLHVPTVTQKYAFQSSLWLLRGKASFSSLSVGKPRYWSFVQKEKLKLAIYGFGEGLKCHCISLSPPKRADDYLKATSLTTKVCSPSCPILSASPTNFLASLTHTSFLPPTTSLELWKLNFSFHHLQAHTDPQTAFLSHLSQSTCDALEILLFLYS